LLGNKLFLIVCLSWCISAFKPLSPCTPLLCPPGQLPCLALDFSLQTTADVAMDGLLAPVSTSYTDKKEGAALVEIKEPQKSSSRAFAKASTPAEALEILKSEPDYGSLISTLQYLRMVSSDFSIYSPSPLAAQLVHVLVSDIVPNYWNPLYESKKPNRKRAKSKNTPDLELVLSCLRSVTGLNALLLSVKQFLQLSKESKKAFGGPSIQDRLTILLQVLTELIYDDDTVEKISDTLWSSTAPQSKQKAIWNELLSIVGSGKILGLAAEAEDVISQLDKKIPEKYWIAEGSAYSSWLARNITHWAKNLLEESKSGWKCCGELLCKAFRLGYSGKLCEYNYEYGLIITQKPSSKRFSYPSSYSTNNTPPSLKCS
jgi:telomere length regulation protein